LLQLVLKKVGIKQKPGVIKLMIMANKSDQGGNKMKNGNGNGVNKNEIEQLENKRLQELLKKAVKTEKAPVSLRDRISQLIRVK